MNEIRRVQPPSQGVLEARIGGIHDEAMRLRNVPRKEDGSLPPRPRLNNALDEFQNDCAKNAPTVVPLIDDLRKAVDDLIAEKK